MIYAYPLMDHVICLDCQSMYITDWEGQGLSLIHFHFITENEVDEIKKIINQSTMLKTKTDVSYRFHPENGYNEAKKWLQEIGEWEYVNSHGFSTDGWSIIATANSMWDKRNVNNIK